MVTSPETQTTVILSYRPPDDPDDLDDRVIRVTKVTTHPVRVSVTRVQRRPQIIRPVDVVSNCGALLLGAAAQPAVRSTKTR